MNSSSERLLLQGLKVLVGLLPLFFFPTLINLYRLPKTAFLAFFVAVLAWGWFLLVAQKKEQSPKIALPLWLPLSLFLVINAISLRGSINPYDGSFYLLQLVLGITLFWLTANHIESKKISTFFHWIVISGGIVSLLGIAQVWGMNIPTLIPTGGPGSTFGNKNMAAQYLLFVIPASFYLLLSTSEAKREWFYAFLASLAAIYFIYTGTRAAWGGATVAFLILWFCLRTRGFSPQELLSFSKRKWGFLLGIVVFVVAMQTIPPYFIPNFGAPPTLTRLQSMLEMETDTSAQGRFAIWANTLAMFKDHPLMGVGKGNYQFNYPLYARRVMKDRSFSAEVTAKETHNDYVQLLAETGIAGFGVFLWVLILVARRFWRVLKRGPEPFPLPVAVVGFSLTAILLEAFWDFPLQLPVPTVFFWIFAGCLWGCSEPDSSLTTVKPGVGKAAIAALAVIATFFSAWSLSSLRAEFYYSRGVFAFQDERLQEADRTLEKAAKLSPLSYRYHFLRGLLMIRVKNYPVAIQEIRRALSLNPYYINALNNLGVAYFSIGLVMEAVRAWETSLKIWPDHTEPHHNLATIYARLGQREKALAHLRELLRLKPFDPLVTEQIRILEAN